MEIKILWVEDDKDFRETLKRNEALNENRFEFLCCDCWDHAMQILKNDYENFDAIILDARCKQHPNDEDNAQKFLVEALSNLRGMEVGKNRLLPWYILSGGDEEEIGNLISDHREIWDYGRPKKYYSKNMDEAELFDRIAAYAHSHQSVENQIKYMQFSEVFEAFQDFECREEIEPLLLDLLCLVSSSNIKGNLNGHFADCRKIIEAILKDMVARKFLPKEVVKERGAVNTNWSLLILGGEDEEIEKQKGFNIPNYQNCVAYNVFPKILSQMVKTIVNSCNASLHTKKLKMGDAKNNKGKREYNQSEYLSSVGNTSYLIRGFVMHICDFIIWYKNFCDSQK